MTRAMITIIGLLALASCTREVDVRAPVLSGYGEQESYEYAFRCARDTLRDQGYLIERVDAESGVITTQRTSEVRGIDDLANRQRHYVRVTFSPPAESQGQTEAGAPDEVTGRAAPVGDRVLLVRVVVERVQRPGWRVPPSSSVRLSRTTYDPALGERELYPVYAVATGEDRSLANRLTDAILQRIGTP